MRLLVIADEEAPNLHHQALRDLAPDLVLSAGDLPWHYLEFVASSVDGRAQGLSVEGLAQDRVHFFTVRPIRGHSPGPASAEVHAPALGSPWQELPH